MELTGDHLERAHTELGPPEATFHVGRGRFLAKLTLGLALVAYGAAANYFWWTEGPGEASHVWILFLVVPPITGASLLMHMYRQRGLFVLVYPTGLLRLRHGEVVSFPWDEVESIRLSLQRCEGPEFARDDDGAILACWLPVDVPTFKLGEAGVTVARDDGVEAHFGPALTDYDQLAEEVQKRTFAVQWSRTLARFRGGERIPFGELEADRAGLRHSGKLLRWRDVKEVVVSQGKLSVKQSGKWLPWALLEVGGVPNPHLLLALADEARRAHAQPEEGSSPQRHQDHTKGHEEEEN
jgi:hypothetical protein